MDRPVERELAYRQFMAGMKIPHEDELAEDILEDVALLIGRSAGVPISPTACREAVALLCWAWGVDSSLFCQPLVWSHAQAN